LSFKISLKAANNHLHPNRLTALTFIIFMIEGIIHYNSGIKICKEKVSHETPFNTLNFFGFQIEIPKKKDLLI
jgi:hypothetical protein